MELKKNVEALLFSAGKKLHIDEIAKLCNSKVEQVKQALTEIKKEYEQRNGSLMVIDEGDFWKLTVREPYLPIVRRIVTDTELSKSVLETLAVIAFKYPIKQSELISLRTNKAYDHLKDLEDTGYISRQKHGRTKLIKLTEKFFEYFDLPPEKLKEHFKDFESIAKTIEEKEKEIEKTKAEKKIESLQQKSEDDTLKEAAKNVDQFKLETYDSDDKNMENQGIILEEEKLGDLQVIETEENKKNDSKDNVNQGVKSEPFKKNNGSGIKNSENKKTGIQLTEEMEKEVDRKVDKMLNPNKYKEKESESVE